MLGIRQEGASQAVEKMENSIQNIILQEMEQLDGIMIATTNLTQNLDKAFERRFLYKIEFEKPSTEAKSRIWRSMIPTLDERTAAMLAARYDFSGGQIENIARNRTIDISCRARNLRSSDSMNIAVRRCSDNRRENAVKSDFRGSLSQASPLWRQHVLLRCDVSPGRYTGLGRGNCCRRFQREIAGCSCRFPTISPFPRILPIPSRSRESGRYLAP